MIYFFSGTGNSAYVAEKLGALLGEELGFISSTDPRNETAAGNSVGFVFPVYSWGVPPNMLDFIKNLPGSFWKHVKDKGLSVWCVMTCGDEVALAPEMFAGILREKGVEPESIWSVVMPNNYVLLPGFDVDSKEVEREKLENAPARIKEIADGISGGRRIWNVVRGGMPWMKTRLVYPLFKRWGIFPGKWKSTLSCVGCGVCAANCPLGNVEIKDGRPVWGRNCCSCLGCYHSCPRHAVAYGSATSKKGQYFLPSVLSGKLKAAMRRQG